MHLTQFCTRGTALLQSFHTESGRKVSVEAASFSAVSGPATDGLERSPIWEDQWESKPSHLNKYEKLSYACVESNPPQENNTGQASKNGMSAVFLLAMVL